MISFFAVFFIGMGLLASINFEKKLFLNSLFFYFTANIIFIFTVLILPEGFADDQYEYFDFMRYDFDQLNQVKYKVMYIISFIPLQIFDFEMLSLRYLFFISYILILLKVLKAFNFLYLSLPILVIMPSVFLHASLFLREPVSYIFITLFIFFVLNKRFLFSFLSFLGVFVIRPDSAGLIAPFFLMLFSYRKDLQNYGILVLLIIYTYLVFYSPISIFLDGYRFLFGVPDFSLSLNSILDASKNLLFGSMIIEIPTLIMLFETVIIFYLIYKIRNRKIIIFIWFIGVLIVGSISDNSGFLLRMRSPIILVTVLYFLYERYESIIDNSVLRERVSIKK